MFTGIVADIGSVASLTPLAAGTRINVRTSLNTGDFELGESIAINGVCLTVDRILEKGFEADVSPETLSRSNLGELGPGSKVNLERALRPVDRLGGHFVLGHVDATGRLTQRKREGGFETLSFSAPPEITRYLVEKGSVAIDGVSLTVAKLMGDTFTVAVIPHTLGRTSLGDKKPGSKVNLEADILGKYVEKLCSKQPAQQGLTMAALAENGFLR